MTIGALIVDDQADFRLLVVMIIQSATADCRVVGEAASGTEAIRIVDELEPDVIVLDEMMPELTGLQTAVRLRQRRPNLPIVLCSAHMDDEVRRKAIACGIDICLSKEEVNRLPEVILEAAARHSIRT